MSAPMLLQGLVVPIVVGWSALFAAHRLMPVASRRAQARLVSMFDHAGLPVWLRATAQRLQPRSSSGGSCGDGCSSCGGCAVADAKPAAATVTDAKPIPLVFRPRAKN
ncbi:MAG: DUF6587 family protein [Dokdonella sp.]